jgi:redox-sensing transcriptional repressor
LVKKEISKAVINRLPRYYRYLGDLLEKDVVRISSKELSEKMKVTASQIRQDLNNFGGFGQQGYGYNVEYLHSEIGKILGLDTKYNMIIIGAGNLGQALANYVDFERRGFMVTGLFDISPKLIGTEVRGVTVRSSDELEEFIENNRWILRQLLYRRQKRPDWQQSSQDGESKASGISPLPI